MSGYYSTSKFSHATELELGDRIGDPVVKGRHTILFTRIRKNLLTKILKEVFITFSIPHYHYKNELSILCTAGKIPVTSGRNSLSFPKICMLINEKSTPYSLRVRSGG